MHLGKYFVDGSSVVVLATNVFVQVFGVQAQTFCFPSLVLLTLQTKESFGYLRDDVVLNHLIHLSFVEWWDVDWYCSWCVDNRIKVVNELDVVLVPWASKNFV